jgi:hypothetical protein
MPRSTIGVFARERVIIKIFGIDEEHEAEIVDFDIDGKPIVFVSDSLRWGMLRPDDFELIALIYNPKEQMN